MEKRRKIDLPFLLNLVRELRRARPRIVVTFLITPDIWGRLAALLAGVPVIGSSVRDLPRPHGRLADALLHAMDRLSQFIVCNSRKSAEVTLEMSRISPAKVSVIYNGIEPAAHEPALVPLPAQKGVMSVGLVARLFPAKDIATLLRAFARISDRVPARLVIVGDGPLRGELERQALALGISGQVLFLGERPDAKLIMHGFDVGVLTSIYEGLSNSMLEAMALMLAGKPVIASAVGGNPELVEDGVTGYLFNQGNDLELSQKLLELLLAPEKGALMGRLGRQKILDSFSVPSMVQRWNAVLTAVSAGPGSLVRGGSLRAD